MESKFKKYALEQEELWNNELGQQWARNFTSMDNFLCPWTEELFDSAKIQLEEKVIDIGCGAGTVAFEACNKVGNAGKVLGVDISGPLIDCANQRNKNLKYSNIEFVLTDAASHSFIQDFDLVVSRFGIMFFGNPIEAFSNIRSALKKTGRLSCVVWRTPRDNHWVSIPITIAKEIIKNPAPPIEEGEPGPFSFSDLTYTRNIFEKSGWKDIIFKKVNRNVNLGSSIQEASELLITRGPMVRLIQNESDSIKLLIEERIQQALEPFYNNRKCCVPGSCWVISASP